MPTRSPRRICGGSGLAEEVVQEAFLSLWRGRGRYDSARGSVRAWVLSVVHNRAIDALRRPTVAAGPPCDELADRLTAPERTEAVVLAREEAREVRRALAELPAEQRRVIELAFFAGLTHSEIAQLLELPAGTVKGRLRLGLHKLRGLLDVAGRQPAAA